VADPAAITAVPGPSVSTGVAWTTVGQFGAQTINFGASLLLTLFLEPGDFGLVGFGFAVTAVADMLIDFGTGAAIVQRRELGPRTVDVAFTISLLLAFAASLLLAAFGGVLAAFGSDAREDAVLLWWLAPTCLFTAVATMPRALLTRHMRLDAIAKAMLASAIARATASLGAAAAGAGAFSLVVGVYVGALVLVLALRAYERTPLRLCWRTAERPELLAFGARLTAFNLVNTVLLNADAFVLTALLGKEAFGIFSLAKRLLLQPVEMAGNVARAVLFPALAQAQQQRGRTRLLYLGADQYMVAGILPLLVGAALLVDLLTGSLLSASWAPVAPVALAMLPAAVVTLLLQSPGPLLLAHGRAGALLRWGIVRGIAMVLAFALAPWLGLQGVVLAMGALLVLCLPWLLEDAGAVLRLRWPQLCASVLAHAPAAVALAVAILAVRQLLDGRLPPLVLLAVAGGVGVAAYTATLVVTRAPALYRVRHLLRHRRRRRSAR